MWSSAVKLALLAVLCVPAWAQENLTPAGGENWARISKSLVTIEKSGKPTGFAVLIDESGLFLAHSSLLGQGALVAKDSAGRQSILLPLTIDEPTQLVLLKAQIWASSDVPIATVESGRHLKDRALIAALPSGPIQGTLVASDRSGIMKPSMRYVPLAEIRFETPQDRVGGAPLFTTEGKLLGFLNATLEPLVQNTIQKSVSAESITNGAARQGFSEAIVPGPTGITVAYALNNEVLQRVVEGFRSPIRRPLHPTIGAYFGEAIGPGALIQGVLPDSPAEKAGLRLGDIVLRAGEQTIKDHFEFAAVLFKQRVGATLPLQVKRGETLVPLQIVIGRQTE